jgi:SAM-dependent methyltransferase
VLREAWRGRSARASGRGGHGGRAGAAALAGASRFSDTELYEAAGAVRELSRGFTRERGLAGVPYMDDPRLLGAYLLFYWPVSYAQAWAAALSAGVAGAASQGGAAPRQMGAAGRVLDLGAGPGPASFALADMGFGRVTAADRSGPALALLRELAGMCGKSVDTRQVDLADPGAPERLRSAGPFDLILAVHTLNELWVGSGDRVARRAVLARGLSGLLAPGGRLLVVEPALTTTANESILLRDELTASGWAVESPCTFAGRCPALPRGTCHAEVEWEPPRELVRLAHAARIGREALGFSYFLLAPPAAVVVQAAVQHAPGTGAPGTGVPAGLYRVVSERFLAKSGRLRVLLCGPEGRFPLSVDGAAHFPAARLFRGLNRYDLVRVGGAQKRETGYGLLPESTLTVVERAPRLT